MKRVSIVGPDAGETVLEHPVRFRILEDGTTTGGRLGIAESVLPPHSAAPQQHRHAGHDEGFYVVRGTVRFTVGSDVVDAVAGTLVMVPPGAPHTFANPFDEAAVMITTFTPDLYVEYFRDTRAWLESGQELTHEASAGLMARYATEPATTYATTDGD